MLSQGTFFSFRHIFGLLPYMQLWMMQTKYVLVSGELLQTGYA